MIIFVIALGIAGSFVNIDLIDKNLYLIVPGQPRYQLLPVKQHLFRVKEFSDYRFEFILDNGTVTAFKQIDPSGEYLIKKQK